MPSREGTQTVGVVIVNWNSGSYLRRSLSCLLAQTRPPDRIVVVDNGSQDDSLANLPQSAAGLEILKLGYNAGFAAANNIAIQRLGGMDWIALLNPDAFPSPDWLARMLQATDSQPAYAFFACRMLVADDPARLDGAGDAYHCTGLPWRRAHNTPAPGRYEANEEVFAACAAAALYRRDALQEVGGFDERFFCYTEDVDLAFRLRLRGHRCLYVADAVVSHVGWGSTTRDSEFSVYHGHRNLVWAFVKNMPGAAFYLLLLPHVFMNLAIILRYAFAGQGGIVLRAKLDAVRGLPETWRQRRELQRGRNVGVWAVLRVMSFGWPRAERFFNG